VSTPGVTERLIPMAVFERIKQDDDARLADYRGVSEPRLLDAKNLLIAEGRLVVTRLIEDTRWVVRSIVVNPAACRALEPVLTAAAARAPVFVCASDLLARIGGYPIHRGCLALVERPPATTIEKLVELSRLTVVLEGVANADNVGGVFRSAAAFGVDAVVLSPACCSPLYRKAVRTSMGATLRVPFVHLERWPEPLAGLREAGFTLVALTPRAGAETLESFCAGPPRSRIALILGAEGAGLSPAVELAADHRVCIPIEHEADSLNVAVAAGIALESIARSRRGRVYSPLEPSP
jgi:tRNA G18 (ribose-2'-O)-methylase SpoU